MPTNKPPRVKNSFAPKTLVEKRWQCLPKDDVIMRSNAERFGWQVVEANTGSPWRTPILACFQQVGQYAERMNLDVSRRVLALMMPLWLAGGAEFPLVPTPAASGADDAAPNAEPGWCAERKLLLETHHLQLSELERKMLTRNNPNRETAAAWLLYTTSSPCRFCLEVMMRHLADPRRGEQAGSFYDHLVVAFEGIYSPFSQPAKAIPDLTLVDSRQRTSYDPVRPGIEFFKIHRDRRACEADKAQFAENPSLVIEEDPFLDAAIAVRRVLPYKS